MLNSVNLMGRMTRDPELRYTQSQTPVASFTLAVDQDYSGKDGSKQADFINCVAWRQTAEFVSKYFHKGSMAVINGRISTRQYQDKAGNNRTAVEVVVENIYFGEKKGDNNASSAPSAPAPAPAAAPASAADAEGYDPLSDLGEFEPDWDELP